MINNSKTYLNHSSFSLLKNWSVQYLLKETFLYNENFNLFPIGKFLIKNRDKVLIENGKEYKRVTVKINNKGVILRNIEKGENIGTKQQYLIRSSQFIMSKIDARNGAFGLVPNNLNGAIVTNDFPVFNVDGKVINPEFLVLLTGTKEFVKFAQSCSSGTTNRQRININLFLKEFIFCCLFLGFKIFFSTRFKSTGSELRIKISFLLIANSIFCGIPKWFSTIFAILVRS